MKDERLDQFEVWLDQMDDELSEFFEVLPDKVSSTLDFSIESLDVIEDWILSQYPSTESILKAERDQYQQVDWVSRYIGETFRMNLGGHWEICIDNPKYVYYSLPQISGFTEKSTPICPHRLVTATADRRTGNYLSTILRNVLKRNKLKESCE